jgi:bacteriocin-like protein
MSKSETMSTGKAGEPAVLTDKELDENELATVSGGTRRENQGQLRAVEAFKSLLAKAGQV